MTACWRWLCITSMLLGMASAQAQVLHWAARGDSQTMDPHAFAESVTQNLNALVYDALVERDRQQRIVPALALRWQRIDKTTWRFELRPGVRFQDGSRFSADDVVFSIERAQQPPSQYRVYAVPLGRPVKIDDSTVELRQAKPNPVLLEQLAAVLIMSRDWTLAHQAARVPEFKSGEEAATTHLAMGTGRYQLVSREPGRRTLLKRNPAHWSRFEGNVQQIVFTPIANDATRTAALLAGDIDFMQDVPPQDMPRLADEAGVRLAQGIENRIVFLGFDLWRDELLYSNVKGRNPLKDERVREAFARVIDSDALRSTTMRGQSRPSACFASSTIGCFAPELEAPVAPDVARARALMREAGYGEGFELTLDCPNDRYVNDRALCIAMVGLLARINVRLKVDARPKSLYFPKVQSGDTSFFLIGWGGSAIDPQLLMDSFVHSPDQVQHKGVDNIGRVSDEELDRWIDAAAAEVDVDVRERLIRNVQRRVAERHYYLPIHRQTLIWAASRQVHPVVTANNMVRVDWFRID